MSNNKTVVVIGAGLVGLCTALSLQKRGYRVHVVDSGEAGAGASMGNPGGLSVTSIFPMAVPGVYKKVPGWILDPLGPLAIRWQHLAAVTPWMLRFLKAATPAQVAIGVGGLYALTAPAVDLYQQLAAQAEAGDLIRADGHLMVYRSQAAMDAENGAWNKRAALGISFEAVDADTLRDMEPELDPAFRFARYVPGNGHVTDPRRLAECFLNALVRNGGRFHHAAAQGFRLQDGKVLAVKTETGELPADYVVLAAGAQSRELARQLGHRVPLEPERGYHAQITHSDVVLQRPVFSTEAKVFAASMEGGLRFAGTAEFAGSKAAPDWRRADGLLQLGRGLFPRLVNASASEQVTRWMGFRPSTPDGLPVLGASCGASNAFFAFGHGHIGVTSAPMTGEIITSLISGETPAVNLAPYSPLRFGR